MNELKEELLKLQSEAVKIKYELRGFSNREKFEEAKNQAQNLFDTAVQELRTQAKNAEQHLSTTLASYREIIMSDPPKYLGIDIFLPDICLNEGISFVPIPQEDPCFLLCAFDVANFDTKDSIASLFERLNIENDLNDFEKKYINKEAEYSNKISGKNFDEVQDSIFKIYDEIDASIKFQNEVAPNRPMLLDALANAAYRNGIEGPLLIHGELQLTCKPTIDDYLKIDDVSKKKIKNFIQISFLEKRPTILESIDKASTVDQGEAQENDSSMVPQL